MNLLFFSLLIIAFSLNATVNQKPIVPPFKRTVGSSSQSTPKESTKKNNNTDGKPAQHSPQEVLQAIKNILDQKNLENISKDIELAQTLESLQTLLLDKNGKELSSTIALLLGEKTQKNILSKAEYPLKATVAPYVKALNLFLVNPTVATYRPLVKQFLPLLKTKIVETVLHKEPIIQKNILINQFLKNAIYATQAVDFIENDKDIPYEQKIEIIKEILTTTVLDIFKKNKFTTLNKALNNYSLDLSNTKNLTTIIELIHAISIPNSDNKKTIITLMKKMSDMTNLEILKHLKEIVKKNQLPTTKEEVTTKDKNTSMD